MSIVGKDIPHDSARGHVTGESIYIDDMLPARNELLVDFLPSPIAHGRIKSVDLSAAASIKGVVALFTYRDLDGVNKFGPIIQDEVLLCEDHVSFIGEPIVVIAAESRAAIKEAKKAIKIDLEELPPVMTIDEARARSDFIDKTYSITRGDAEGALKAAEHKISGTFVIGGQDHFYLESQAALVYPGEFNQLTVHSSTQNPSEVQQVIARVLGLRQNQVVVITKRMGGGFGGKECQATHPAAMAALVALKTKRPARIIYTKDDDMKYTGKRHPFQNDYTVGFTAEGVITALKAHLFCDGGAANDLSTAVLGRALTHVDNAYYIPDVDVKGNICRTNHPPTTAFRGFGGPQGIATIENIMEEIAAFLGLDPYDVRRRNCYGVDDRNTTPYGQLVTNNTLPRLFDELCESSHYKKRYEDVRQFNATSRTHIKGIAMTAVKFGISFTNKFLNQANALVNVYLDGTVQASTGATEMGQGVNTNIKQLVAEELGIEADAVIIMPTSTEKNNNTSATAASAATDLNGSAAVDACRKIKASMAQCAAHYFAERKGGKESKPESKPESQIESQIESQFESECGPVFGPEPERIVFENSFVYDARRPDDKLSFKDLVGMCYRNRISLGERGYYATRGIDFDWAKGQGTPFLYYTNGCAVTEVLIDRFTGKLKIVRFDVLMDIGKSINPGINRGQITGGFIQGVGWVTTEELKYSDSGHLLSYSPTTYKIPNIQDIPDVFNVNVIDNPTNTQNVRASKAVGEPPLVLGLSAWAAVKQALSHLCQNGIAELAIPATGEEILKRLTQYGSLSSRADDESKGAKAEGKVNGKGRGKAGKKETAAAGT